ncbi:hypothetical protein SAY87_022754 [Trapa incisa]|uniref:Far-red elongated hypocotyl 1 n=2 Tax=Trapa TaxID=22665 RepID=A0AAN7LMG3_TRANT|nr:hypothetical protein SAY87_022754 [Trapa incisa]KAK4783486.1 hypothetical protein SAY86_007860 [Trapa natans]
MDEDDCNPLEISRFQAIEGIDSKTVDLKKKRKLGLEHLDLPWPKHRYGDRGCSNLIPPSSENKSLELCSRGLPTDEIEEKMSGDSTNEESESHYESAKGSNSIAEDIDSAMADREEDKLRPGYIKSGDRPSTLTGDKGKSIVGTGEGSSQYSDGGYQSCETFDEQLLEFGYHLDGEDNCSKQSAVTEIEEEPFGLRQVNYILSSGRWNTNEETGAVPRNPTIDQEFEEYFSSLMM